MIIYMYIGSRNPTCTCVSYMNINMHICRIILLLVRDKLKLTNESNRGKGCSNQKGSRLPTKLHVLVGEHVARA